MKFGVYLKSVVFKGTFFRLTELHSEAEVDPFMVDSQRSDFRRGRQLLVRAFRDDAKLPERIKP